MTHQYPLHIDLDAECYCCGALQHFLFTSPTDQVVCTFCTNHLGETKAERRDRDHVRLWSERHGELRRLFDQLQTSTAEQGAETEATTAELRGTVQALRRTIADQFDSGPADGIRSLIENDVTRRAERSAKLVERRNDRLMAVLERIDALHHDADAGSLGCSCGKKTAVCAEWKAVQTERMALRDWERRARERRATERATDDHRAGGSLERRKSR